MGSEVGSKDEDRVTHQCIRLSFVHFSLDVCVGVHSAQGLIPRFLEQVFHHIEHMGNEGAMLQSAPKSESSVVVANPILSTACAPSAPPPTVTVSFLEIYGEDIFDLLTEDNIDTNGKTRSLALREDSGAVSVVGLTQIEITNSMEAMEQLRVGTLNRTTASTLMNTVSSRSHAVFTVTLRQVRDLQTCTQCALAGRLSMRLGCVCACARACGFACAQHHRRCLERGTA